MITRGFVTDTIITRGFGVRELIQLVGRECLAFVRTETVRGFAGVKRVLDFIRGC